MAIVGGIICSAVFTVLRADSPNSSRLTAWNAAPSFLRRARRRIRFIDKQGKFHLQPFVYGLEQQDRSESCASRTFVEDPKKIYPISFFRQGEQLQAARVDPMQHPPLRRDRYRKTRTHPSSFMGTDSLGRDFFSRILYGGRLSLLIGLIGQMLDPVLWQGAGRDLGLLWRHDRHRSSSARPSSWRPSRISRCSWRWRPRSRFLVADCRVLHADASSCRSCAGAGWRARCAA